MAKPKLIKEGKITVKHFLNTRLKGKLQNGINTYPIYVKIIVKGQSAEFKSQINSYVAPEHFEWFSNEHKLHLQKEVRVLEDITKRLKPFENEGFNVDVVPSKYEEAAKKFADNVEYHLLYEIKKVVAVAEWKHKQKKNQDAFEVDLENYVQINAIIDHNSLLSIINWKSDISTIIDALIDYVPYARKDLLKLQQEFEEALIVEQGYKGFLRTVPN